MGLVSRELVLPTPTTRTWCTGRPFHGQRGTDGESISTSLSTFPFSRVCAFRSRCVIYGSRASIDRQLAPYRPWRRRAVPVPRPQPLIRRRLLLRCSEGLARDIRSRTTPPLVRKKGESRSHASRA